MIGEGPELKNAVSSRGTHEKWPNQGWGTDGENEKTLPLCFLLLLLRNGNCTKQRTTRKEGRTTRVRGHFHFVYPPPLWKLRKAANHRERGRTERLRGYFHFVSSSSSTMKTAQTNEPQGKRYRILPLCFLLLLQYRNRANQRTTGKEKRRGEREDTSTLFPPPPLWKLRKKWYLEVVGRRFAVFGSSTDSAGFAVFWIHGSTADCSMPILCPYTSRWSDFPRHTKRRNWCAQPHKKDKIMCLALKQRTERPETNTLRKLAKSRNPDTNALRNPAQLFGNLRFFPDPYPPVPCFQIRLRFWYIYLNVIVVEGPT